MLDGEADDHIRRLLDDTRGSPFLIVELLLGLRDSIGYGSRAAGRTWWMRASRAGCEIAPAHQPRRGELVG